MKNEQVTNEELERRMYRYDKTAVPLRSLSEIGDERIREYKETGFLAVENVLSGEEIVSAINALMDIVHSNPNGASVQYVKPAKELNTPEERESAARKVFRFVNHIPALRAIAYQEQLLLAVEKLLGDKPVLIQDMALLKPPNGGGEKPWHQDMAYGGLTFDKPIIGVWIALDAAGLDNGCMHVIPRSHMDGAIPHYSVRDWQICDSRVVVERDVTVPLDPGGVLFFHGMLHHGTPTNTSSKRRRALQFHYAGASSAKVTPQEYKRFFTNEMSGAEC